MARLVCRRASCSGAEMACVVMGFPVLKNISMRGRLPLYKFLEHFVREQASARRKADGIVFEVEKSVLHQLFDGGYKLVRLFTESLSCCAQRHAAIQAQTEEERLFQRLSLCNRGRLRLRRNQELIQRVGGGKAPALASLRSRLRAGREHGVCVEAKAHI